MQIKTIRTPLAASAAVALILVCGEIMAEPAGTLEVANLTPRVNTSTSPSAQDEDIAAPPDVAAPPAGASRTNSGLSYRVLEPGTGSEHPSAADEVTVHYTGWTTDGKMFDSSVQSGQPSTFPLGAVIAGWTEGLQLMVVGEKTRFWIPEDLAYKGRAGKPAGLLVFDVELINIKTKPKVPDNLNAPPADAITTASGLKIHSMQKGSGTLHPGPSDQVTVHYSGWTTDGNMFDSSVDRGESISFPLGGVIPGWTEALQLMVVGEKARLWIPEAIAYQGQPGAPAGLLVFDVELLEITPAPKTPDNLSAPPQDALTLESGVILHTMRPGKAGQNTKLAAAVLVHFTFWDQSGKMYQSSRMSGRPVPMEMGKTPIKGLNESLSLLSLGQSVRLWIPEDLAFGGQPGAPKGTLVFDVEVMRIFNAPPDLAQAPAGATRTESGLAYMLLKASQDPEATMPTANSKVVMHYAGWKSTGELFDSSHFQAEPGTYMLGNVMPGWKEGLQLMKTGDSFRFWIPEALGMGRRQGAPSGDVVFDIELISIK